MKHVLLLSLIVLYGCPSPYIQPIKPADTSSCAPGCAQLKKLGCPEASGSNSKDPNSCVNDCTYVQNNGLSIRPSCWVTMTACSQLETTCK